METIKSNLPLYLTRSRVRADLLTLFFLNPSSSYYVRELERRLGFSVGALARELKTFSDEGFLLREARGREIFYRLNEKHPLFNEIKNIVEKTVGIPKRLAQEMAKMKEVKEAYLYGSFVSGTMTHESDIDLLIVGEETNKLIQLFRKLETTFGREINTVVYSPSEFEKKRRDRSEFLYEVFKSNQIISLKTNGSH